MKKRHNKYNANKLEKNIKIYKITTIRMDYKIFKKKKKKEILSHIYLHRQQRLIISNYITFYILGIFFKCVIKKISLP